LVLFFIGKTPETGNVARIVINPYLQYYSKITVQMLQKIKKPPLVIATNEGFSFLKSGIYSFELGTCIELLSLFIS